MFSPGLFGQSEMLGTDLITVLAHRQPLTTTHKAPCQAIVSSLKGHPGRRRGTIPENSTVGTQG